MGEILTIPLPKSTIVQIFHIIRDGSNKNCSEADKFAGVETG
jgi:hypothetical protein